MIQSVLLTTLITKCVRKLKFHFSPWPCDLKANRFSSRLRNPKEGRRYSAWRRHSFKFSRWYENFCGACITSCLCCLAKNQLSSIGSSGQIRLNTAGWPLYQQAPFTRASVPLSTQAGTQWRDSQRSSLTVRDERTRRLRCRVHGDNSAVKTSSRTKGFQAGLSKNVSYHPIVTEIDCKQFEKRCLIFRVLLSLSLICVLLGNDMILAKL